ncbi:hypothetical protein FKM82_029005 [Ascaphus truei]
MRGGTSLTPLRYRISVHKTPSQGGATDPIKFIGTPCVRRPLIPSQEGVADPIILIGTPCVRRPLIPSQGGTTDPIIL